jgi:glutamate formiminotransferase
VVLGSETSIVSATSQLPVTGLNRTLSATSIAACETLPPVALVMIPNVSEGRSTDKLRALAAAVWNEGGRVLDVHSDPVHNRCVLTVTGRDEDLVNASAALALEATEIDLTMHQGVHPRLGGLDVCPFVPHDDDMGRAISAAHAAGDAIATRANLPVYFYGAAALQPEAAELPRLRRGGLEDLIQRARDGFVPDVGPKEIDPARGVVCVGARAPLIAFNVWLRADPATARSIAAAVRSSGGGPPGIRALGLVIDDSLSQISMNLVEPEVTGIDAAFEAVRVAAADRGAEIHATEIVGLVPENYMPDPDAQAARLLMTPGRCLDPLLGN